jgi:trans-aconitate methyltransferase
MLQVTLLSVSESASNKRTSSPSLIPLVGWTLLFSSNAALHWSHKHDSLFPHLIPQLRSAAEGGILAVQMQHNFRRNRAICAIRQSLKIGGFFEERGT